MLKVAFTFVSTTRLLCSFSLDDAIRSTSARSELQRLPHISLCRSIPFRRLRFANVGTKVDSSNGALVNRATSRPCKRSQRRCRGKDGERQPFIPYDRCSCDQRGNDPHFPGCSDGAASQDCINGGPVYRSGGKAAIVELRSTSQQADRTSPMPAVAANQPRRASEFPRLPARKACIPNATKPNNVPILR